MLKIKLSRLLAACVAALALTYPVSVYAAIQLENRAYTAPFLFSWLGVWVFSIAGGICASFVRITDIDSKLYAAIFAKMFIGTFSGVALCLLIAANAEPPEAALTFWAFAASLFSSPLATGALVYISNQRRLDSIFNRVSRHAQDRYLPINRDYQSGNENKDDDNDDISTPLR